MLRFEKFKPVEKIESRMILGLNILSIQYNARIVKFIDF